MDIFTCKVMTLGKAKTPAKIELLGDKTKRPEPAQHAIEFPGGAIEVSRTSDGNYWAHIHVNRDFAMEDCEGYRNSLGEVVGSRIGRTDSGVEKIENEKTIYQIAVLIKKL